MENCTILTNEEVLAKFGRTDYLPIKIDREYFKKCSCFHQEGKARCFIGWEFSNTVCDRVY